MRERRKDQVPLPNGTGETLPIVSQICSRCWSYVTEQKIQKTRQRQNKTKTTRTKKKPFPSEPYNLVEGDKEIIKIYACV